MEDSLDVLNDPSVEETENKDNSIVLRPSKGLPVNSDVELLQQLPNMDVQFQLVTDKTSKIVSLKEVEDQIIESGTMDTGRATVVAESFPDILPSHVIQNGFTKYPTKTGFGNITKKMRERIAKEEYELLDLFNVYLKDPFEQASNVLKSIQEKSLPGLIRITESLISELKQNPDKILKNDNTHLPISKSEVVNITTTNLLRLDMKEMVEIETLKTFHQFKQAVATIKEIFICKRILLFVSSVLGGEHDGESISVADLYKFITSPEFVRRLKEEQGILEELLSNTAVVVKEAEGVADKPDKVVDVVLKNTAFLTDFHAALMKQGELVYYLTFLNLAVKQMLLTYNEM